MGRHVIVCHHCKRCVGMPGDRRAFRAMSLQVDQFNSTFIESFSKQDAAGVAAFFASAPLLSHYPRGTGPSKGFGSN
jgi:hypothetical protein